MERGIVTVCGGCDSECAFEAYVDSEGFVRASLPVSGHPCCAERLCGRGKRRLALPHLQRDSIEHPLRRTASGAFEPISWEMAYAEIAERVCTLADAHGPSSLACTLGITSHAAFYVERLMAALGSPNVYGANGACEVSRCTGWNHTLGYSPQSDLAHTDYIVYLGRSPLDSASVNEGELVERALARGATVVCVDPRRNSTVDVASRWLKIRPGRDLALLLGLAHVLIEEGLYDRDFVERHTTGFAEFAQAMAPYTAAWAARECGVAEADVLEVARGLGRARPRAVVDAGFHGGLGVAYVNGAQTSRVLALVNALLGNFGQEGGNLNPRGACELGRLDPVRFPAPPPVLLPKVGSERYPLVDPEQGLCTTIGESIAAGQIRGLLAYASNPAMGYGNGHDWARLLGGLDLLVAVDIRMSETARLAHYVLPDVTFLESDRGVGLRDGVLYYRNPVLRPLYPDARPASRIVRELAEALGLGRYFSFTPDDLARAQVAPFGVDLEELRRVGWAPANVEVPARVGEPVILTPSGKVEFASDLWERSGLGRVPFWQPPLVDPQPGEFRLINGNSPFESHTSTAMLAPRPGDPAHESMASVWLHADRARELGVCDGDMVEVYSDLGCDRAIARVTHDLHPEALYTSASPGGRSGKNAGAREAPQGALGVGPLDHTPLRFDPLTGSALTQENAVRVRRVGPQGGDAPAQ